MCFSRLLSSKYFAPLFWTQFLGAFNDNVYKNALVILLSINGASYTDISIELLIPLCGGIFILPFFVFSALAGQLADKFEKSQLIRLIKIAEINIMLLASVGFYLQNIWFLLAVLFFMGCQSSLFGPVKYSILPQHLSEQGLLKGNAMIELGTFLAILLGTIIGGVLISNYESGHLYVSLLVVFIAIMGWFSSLKIPRAESANKHLNINFNFVTQTGVILRNAAKERLILATILGISWFWLIGATILSIIPLPAFTQRILWADKQVITLLLALFSIGIGVGSIIAGRAKNLVKSFKWVVIGSMGISLSSLDLYWLSQQLLSYHAEQNNTLLVNWQALFEQRLSLNVLIDILFLGIAGGLYIVPLYVVLQEYSDIKSRSRTIAANNIVNALFMVSSAIITMLLLNSGVQVQQLFIIIGASNIVVIALLYKFFAADLHRFNQ